MCARAFTMYDPAALPVFCWTGPCFEWRGHYTWSNHDGVENRTLYKVHVKNVYHRRVGDKSRNFGSASCVMLHVVQLCHATNEIAQLFVKFSDKVDMGKSLGTNVVDRNLCVVRLNMVDWEIELTAYSRLLDELRNLADMYATTRPHYVTKFDHLLEAVAAIKRRKVNPP
jgi:hypothetical protein